MRVFWALVLVLGCVGPAFAVSKAQVDRYIALDEAFDQRMKRPVLSSDDRRKRANCILSRFEAAKGQDGVADLLVLMRVLSQGVAFDDPTVEAFTQAHGPVYQRTLRDCR